MMNPFQYEFFQNGSIAAACIGLLCGVVGTFVVLRRMSYIGHGLSHAVFAGAVISTVLNINFYLGAGVWGVVCALLINQVSKKRIIGADAAIGIITTASFAVGVALISRVRHFTRNFEAALFGNVLGVSSSDVWVIIGVTVVTCVGIFFLYSSLVFLTFDPDGAQASRVRGGWIDTMFSVLLAIALIISLQIMGVTLVAALLVIPATTARLLTSRIHIMAILSGIIGMLSGIIGMYGSFFFDVASGAGIVLVSSVIFLVVYISAMVAKKPVIVPHDHL